MICICFPHKNYCIERRETVLGFYREYYSYSRKKASDFKIVYLKSVIEKNKIYKFIAFDDNEKSNLRKLECLRGDML